MVSLAVNSDHPWAARELSWGSVCLRAAALAITLLADVHYIIYILFPSAAPQALSHPPVLHSDIPDPIQPLPTVLAPWHLSTFPSLPLLPARPRSVCHPPQKPTASPACPWGCPSRASGSAPQPGVPKPVVTQRDIKQAQGAAPTSGLGVLPHMPDPTVVPMRSGRGEGAQPCEPIPCLSPSA